MEVVGLITEYNPFHKGHAYHIAKAKEITGADYALVIMSGDFVQRGAPAIYNKRIRTEMALMDGADAVLELPASYATGSSEYFAYGAVSILHHLNIIDFLCFGAESEDLSSMRKIADFLNHEPDSYQSSLQDHLKSGLTYPAARNLAMSASGFSDTELSLLSSPNNILGIEYCRALSYFESSIEPFLLLRKGSSYHSSAVHELFSSATSIRELLEKENTSPYSNKDLSKALTPSTLALLQKKNPEILTLNDFSLLLNYKLLLSRPEELASYVDVTHDLTNRIKNNLNTFETYSEFIQLLKTKETTYTRISRSLLHILTGLTRQDMEQYKTNGWAYYARLLGFRRSSSDLLTHIKKESRIPLITKPGNAKLSPIGHTQLDFDIQCSNLYETIYTHKYHTPFTHELQKQLVIL